MGFESDSKGGTRNVTEYAADTIDDLVESPDPSTINRGVTADGHIAVWNGSTWVVSGGGGASGAGSAGATGASGASVIGASGAAGSVGATGAGATGASGASGAAGSVGATGASAGQGRLLAAIQYAPASSTLVTVTNTTSPVVADAVNLTIAFVFPASGNALVRATMPIQGPTATYGYLCLMDHTSHAQVGYSNNIGQNDTWVAPVTCSWLISGTPGASVQYDLGVLTASSVTWYLAFQGAQGIPSSNNRGIGIMEVLAA